MREQHILPYLCPLLMSWIFPEYGNKLANEAANGLPRDNFNFFGNDISSDACSWEVRVSEMPDRIPSKITEIYCKNHGSACHRSSLYECQQLTTQMNVAYLATGNDTTLDKAPCGTDVIVHRRNIMVGIGCGCVRRKDLRFLGNRGFLSELMGESDGRPLKNV